MILHGMALCYNGGSFSCRKKHVTLQQGLGLENSMYKPSFVILKLTKHYYYEYLGQTELKYFYVTS